MAGSTFSSDYTLLIQGPILSMGRTGATSSKDLTRDSIVNYECEDLLVTIIKEFGYLFSKILIITWQDEKIDEARFSVFKDCRIIKLQDIAPRLVVGKRNLPTDFNNKYKQFYALSQGVEFVDTEYVVKIRTDQYIDLKMLLEEHQSAIKANSADKDKLYIPFIISSNFLVSDFYFVSTKKLFSEYVKAMIWNNYLEFNSSVHIDLSLKYAYVHHRDRLRLPLRTYFLNSFSKNNNQDKVTLRNFLSTTVYKLLSVDIYNTIIWRGDKTQITPNAIFLNDSHTLLLDKNEFRKSNFRDHIYINVPSFLAVRFPFIRGTFIQKWISKLYKLVKK